MGGDPSYKTDARWCGVDGFHASEKYWKWTCSGGAGEEHADWSQTWCNKHIKSAGCEWDSEAQNFKLVNGKTCAELMNKKYADPNHESHNVYI